MKAFRNLLLILVTLTAALPALAQSIGRILVASGEVTLVRGAATQPATSGLALEVGDRVRTGAAGTAQLWFTDTSVVALRNGTEFVVEQYRYTNSATDNLVFNLVRGGFRTVAGLIGIKEQKSYVVKTRMATLGRRGTQYGIVYCERDCPLPEGGLAPDGLYGGVYDGLVGVANNTPEVQFGRDQYFFVASIDSIPQPLLGPPSFLADRLTGLAKNAQKPAAEPPASRDTATNEEESRTAAAAPPPPNYSTTENRTTTGAPSVIGNSGPAIGLLTAYVQNGSTSPGPGAESGFLQPANYSTRQVGNESQLTGISASLSQFFTSGPGANGTFTANVGTAGTDMAGRTLANVVTFGRWSNGQYLYSTSPPAQTPGTGIHFIYGVETLGTVLAAKTGLLNFYDIGGTVPTLNNGVQATTFSFAPIQIDFTARTANMGTSLIVFPNATVSVFGNPSTLFALVPGRGGYLDATLVANCSGSGCGGSSFGSGFFRGIFFGVNGDYIGMSLNVLLGQAGTHTLFSTVRVFSALDVPPVALLIANSLQEANGSMASYNFAASVPASAITTSGTGPSQTLTAFNMAPLFTFSGAVGGSGIDMAGYDSDSGVYYGRWINGSITSGANQAPQLPPGTQTSGMGVHYMYGSPTADSVIAAKTGSAQYVDYVGTQPTASNGQTANAFTLGPININFTNRTGVITSVDVSFPTSFWQFSNLPFNINVTPGQGASFDANLINVGSCSGSGCGPIQGSNTARADFFGRFMGNSGNFLGLSFQGNSGGNTPSGNPNLTMGMVRLYKCPSCP